MSTATAATAAPLQSGEGEKEMFFHILRDMSEGVLVLDGTGTVLHLNAQGQALLGEKQSLVGQKYAAVFAQNVQRDNDAFHQFILDAVYDKEHSHSGEVDYTAPDGTRRRFLMTSSFLRGEDLQKPNGVMVVFSDVTELARLHRQRRESSIVFAVLMICVCAYLFLWSLLRYLGIDLLGQVMTVVIEGISILMFFIILKTTSFSIRDIGLRVTDPKATFVPDLVITAVGAAVLAAGKLVLLRAAPGFFPAGAPFWDWRILNWSSIVYPLTVVLQEFLARGVMQENLRRIFDGKHAAALSIIVSSLVFGVLHIAYGLPFMLGASLLLGALGVLYHKQGNIWGLCIIHYVLGEVATFLRYLT